MAVITTGVLVGATTAAAALEARQGRKAASRAAGQQAEGVEAARDDTLAATERGRAALSGLDPLSMQLNSQQESGMLEGKGAFGGQLPINTAKHPDGMPQIGGQAVVDPRQELLSGVGGQLGFTDQGFQSSASTLSPLAQMAMPFMDEQSALLGFGGEGAQQDALGRVADPLQAEQERAFMRNNAQFGGVGGNALSALAEQTRARTEANIGNRLSQLGSAASPSLNALQQMSNLQLNRGLSMSDIMGGAGRDLASQETSRRQALANMELGQGSELAQLSQNLGTARAGGSAFAAQNPSPLSAGLNSGLNTFLAMGGMRQAPPSGGMIGGGGAVNPNRFGAFA